MSFTGAWQGDYSFEEAACDKEAASLVGRTVAFTLELQQGWLGALNGTVQDDPRTGFAEPGKIKGRFKGNALEFRMLMPVFRLLHENRITLEQWSERRKLVMDTETPHPPILFEGTLSDDGNAIEGTWKMNLTTLQVPGSYLNLSIPTIGGTWRAGRKT